MATTTVMASTAEAGASPSALKRAPLAVTQFETRPVPDSSGNFTAVAVTYENGKPVLVKRQALTAEGARAAAAIVPGAVAVELDTPVASLAGDPLRFHQYDLDRLRMPQLTSRPDMSTQVVAVIDTGVRATHEDFGPGVVLCAQGTDYTGENLGPCADPHGHGSHVAGTVAATTGNDKGIEGMASAVRILPMRVLNSSGSGTASSTAQAIIDSVTRGATVINLSLGGPYSSLYDTAVKHATDNNVVVVAATGNNRHLDNAPLWPASSPGAIGVGATDQSDDLTYFSTTGSQVDVVAPGLDIASLDSFDDVSYLSMSGTSMASPHVAAFAAMVRAKNTALSDDQVFNVLTATAIDKGAAGRDDLYGYGLMNPVGALAAAPSAPTITSVSATDSSVAVNWSDGADNGAVATGYTMTAVPTAGGSTVTQSIASGGARPATFSGLVAGTNYNIHLKTTNGAGIGPNSTAAAITTTGTAQPPPTSGYRLLAGDGAVTAHGTSVWYGDAAGRLSGQAVTIAVTKTGNGYWIASSKGEVLAFGDAGYFGSMAGLPLNMPVINMAVTPSGNGYWLLAQDGGVFTFGDAPFFGSTGGIRLNQPAVGMTATKTGGGYWFVAADGGIFAFGDAAFYGSMGSTPLNKPVVGMTVSPTGNGYRMVASDGGIFSFGDAPFYGSLGANPPASPVRAMQPTKSNFGYWMVNGDGSVYSFGDASYFGRPTGRSIVAMTY